MTRPRINPEISLGSIIQVAAIAGLGLIAWGARDEKGASTASAVASFDTRLTREMTEVRRSLEEVRATVNPIGTLNTRTTEIERRLTEQDIRDNGQDQRLGAIAETIAALRARVDYTSTPGRRTAP